MKKYLIIFLLLCSCVLGHSNRFQQEYTNDEIDFLLAQYLRLDTANDPLLNHLDFGGFNAFGVGTVTADAVTGQNSFTSAQSGVIRSIKTGAITTGTRSALDLKQVTPVGDMTDGFGPCMDFYIEDDAEVQNKIAAICAVHDDGDDTSGQMILRTYDGGVEVDGVTIDPDGVVRILTTAVITGSLIVGSNNFNVIGATGDTTIQGKLDHAGSTAAFVGATPTTKPTNTDAIDTLLVDLGLRATGGVANFDTRVEVEGGNDLRLYETDNTNYVGFKAGTLASNTVWTLPTDDGATCQFVKTNGSDVLSFATPTVGVPVALTEYDPLPARDSESNMHGAFVNIDEAASLSSGVPFVATAKGIGKVVIAIIAGSDVTGDITVTGTSVNRETGATTGSDTSVITLTGVTTDSSTTDSNGNIVHTFTKAYITDKWFTGAVTLSTTDVTITDMDIYHISFEQFNDNPTIVLNTFDVNLQTTNVNAEFDAYLFDVHVTGDECEIENHAALHVGADGETALVDKYWRLRRGNIGQALDGTTDGIWVDIHYSNSPAYVEDVTVKVWATCTVSIDLN